MGKISKIKNSLAALLLTISSSCALPQKMNEYRNHPEKYQPKYTAAILVAEPTVFYDYLRTPFMWLYELRVANALKTNLGVESYYIVTDAGWKDLKTALLDEEVKVLVIAGHGELDRWYAGDELITDQTLISLIKDNPQINKDWFIRHTCGSEGHSRKIIPKAARMRAIEEVTSKGGWITIGSDSSQIFFQIPFESKSEEGTSEYEEEKREFLDQRHKIFTDLADSEIETKTPLGYLVVSDPSHVLGWDRITTPLDFLLNPLPGMNKDKK
ncbi:hypothetical protein HZA97_07410 [Candidatus Woesearchaeota archaeon]|nr:hypothetical protein [Candidatus Woesearchaeota archaeon]